MSGDPSPKSTDGERIRSQPVTAASGLIADDMYSAGAQCLLPVADGNNSCVRAFQIRSACIDAILMV